ncbi:HET-domain-containing protein [Xylariaceae sp. FL1651]|nr:HET-domain-containing protein [Xylariaceae sp. FL1651]
MQYVHRALEQPSSQIRLLVVHPGIGTIRCSLVVVQIDASPYPEYEPISYCWSAQEHRRRLVIDGAWFEVGYNLYTALEHLRSRDTVRTLWCDAICINQTDILERNVQIPLIRHIYQHGQRTIVWLGEQDHKTAHIFRLLKDKAQRIGHQASSKHHRPKIWANPFGILVDEYKMERDITAMNAFFSRSWFHRVWVIQEVSVSSNIVVRCGMYSLEWDSIAEARQSSTESLESCFRTLVSERRSFQTRQPRSLADLVSSSISAQATDPRDRIYAVMGLITSQNDQLDNIVVDYNMETQELLERVTRSCLLSTNDANYLLLMDRGSQIPGHPSWVWSPYTCQYQPERQYQFWSAGYFSATLDAKSVLSFSLNHRIIQLRGYVFDLVTEIGPVIKPEPPDHWPANQSYLQWVQHLIRGYLESCRLARTSPDQAYDGKPYSREEAFHRTLIIWESRDSKEKNEAILRSIQFGKLLFKCAKHVLTSPILACLSVTALWSWLNALWASLRFILGDEEVRQGIKIRKLYGYLDNRRVFITSKGYIGLASRLLAPGDELALIQGVRVPVVLRPLGQNKRLVCESYVHGIMNGELWDPTKCGPVSVI